MCESEAKCAIASHGNAGDGSPCPPRPDAVFALDIRHEFPQKKFTVTHRTVGGVDVEAAHPFRRSHQKVANLVLLAQILDQVPSSRVDQRLLVLSKTVQKVEHRVAPRNM